MGWHLCSCLGEGGDGEDEKLMVRVLELLEGEQCE
jgi:hypothetical protein